MSNLDVLLRVVWCPGHAYELVLWLETSESGLGDMFKLTLAFWERPESGLGHILKLPVAS